MTDHWVMNRAKCNGRRILEALANEMKRSVAAAESAQAAGDFPKMTTFKIDNDDDGLAITALGLAGVGIRSPFGRSAFTTDAGMVMVLDNMGETVMEATAIAPVGSDDCRLRVKLSGGGRTEVTETTETMSVSEFCRRVLEPVFFPA